MISLRARLSAGLAASLVVLLALQWSIAGLVIGQLVEKQVVNRLTQDAENLLSGIVITAQGLALDPARVSAVYQRPFSGHYYVIRTAGHIESSRSLWDGRLQLRDVRPGARMLMRMQGPERQPLLVVAHGYQKQGQSITVTVAEDMSEINAGLRQFKLIHGAISFGILVALLGLQYFIVTRALKPLQKVRADMQRLERGEIEQIDPRGPQEILPLISELNRLLAAMGRKTRRSREAMGNLAHALKTQLALLNQASRHPYMHSHLALQAWLQEIGESMRVIVERELKRARLSGAALPGKRVNLQQEVDGLVQTLRAMYADKEIAIEWRVSPQAHFSGDREDVLELLGNLLDNACKWCRKCVRLGIADEDDLVLVVEDDGPGCEPAALDALVKRGFRLDESKPGSGLGLAIVQDIVEGYEGTISFGNSPILGGLLVNIHLPATRLPGESAEE